MEVDQENTRLSDMISANEHQTEDNVSLLPIESTNTTGTYLEHLNEDCLLEIFASNLLTPMDLCSLAETCTRFKQMIERVFSKEYGIAEGDHEYKFRSKNGTEFNAELQDVERILKNFGSHLTKLEVCSEDEHLAYLVGMYCGDVTLNSLHISRLRDIEGVRMHMNSILQRLRKLYVSNCNFLVIGVKSQNLHCDSLIELKIRESQGCMVILKHNFPNLERFSWHGSHAYTKHSYDESELYQFIQRHGHLKTIDVLDVISVPCSRFLNVIDSSCKQLDQLILHGLIFDKLSFDFSTQGGLSNLKIVDFDFSYHNLSRFHTFFQALTSLETMKMSYVAFPVEMLEALSVLSQLQNLRELQLTDCPFDHIRWTMLPQLRRVHLCARHHCDMNFPNIIRQLINLEELESEYYTSFPHKHHFELKKDEVTEIVKIVERREHVLTLKFRFEFKLKEICNKSQKVKLIKMDEIDLFDEIKNDVSL